MPLATFPFIYIMWLWNDRFWSIITPRNFVLSVMSIFMLLMVRSADSDILTRFLRNKMKCVLFKFKDNLFICSQSTTLIISSFIILIRSSGFFPDKNIFESSAKSKANNLLDTLHKSFIYKRKSSGPNIEPCGTPHVMIPLPELTLLYSTYCVLSER